MVKGLYCLNPLDPYNEIIFMVKRLIGVPNYYYLKSEFPENYDRKNLELYKHSRWDRTFIWLSVMTRQFLLRVFIIRWFYNISTFLSEFFVRYFPFIAFCRFGFRNGYVGLRK
jgi:hypothetical protein